MRPILFISGLDPTGSGGLLADARVAAALDARPVGVAAALSVQDTAGVRSVHSVPAEVVGDQLRCLLSDVEVAAVKLGILSGHELMAAVADALALTGAPLVWDPGVLRGDRSRGAFDVELRGAAELLRGHLSLVTPSAFEAELLVGFSVTDRGSMRRAATALSDYLRTAVLITGGQLDEGPIDVLAEGASVTEFAGERVDGARAIAGTGGVLASAIAVHLGRGAKLRDAIERARGFVRARLESPVSPGRGRPATV